MMFVRLIVFGVVISCNCASALAVDWAQWRGPQRTGVSAETGLADSWPAGGPKLVWQAKDVGDGYGSPAIVGNRIYLLGNEGLENEFVQAIDASNGRQVWRQRIGKVGEPNQSPNYPGARSTPTVDGEHLYALGSDGDMACLEVASGRIVWQKNLRREFNGVPGDWAYAESPLIDGNDVVCTPGGLEAAMVKLNKRTGDLVWKCALPEPEDAGFASALIVNFEGHKLYVQYFSKGVVGIDANSGRYLWRALNTERDNMATPIEKDGLIYSPAFLSVGGMAKLEVTDGKMTAKEFYRKRGLPTQIGGAVLVDEHLYGTVRDGLVCADFKTGDVKWKGEASVAPGAVCSADGLIFVHGEESEVALVEATPAAYREKGRFKLPEEPQRSDQEKAWTFPVVAGGRLYIRDKNFLWCYDVSDGAATTGR